MGPATRDLVNAAVYLVALGAILAGSTLTYATLLRAMPAVVAAWMPEGETSGFGGTGNTRSDTPYVPWRLSPPEAQRRFATRSAVLLPPTPAYPEPPGGWPAYDKRAPAIPAALARLPGPPAVSAPVPAELPAPVAQVDFQMGGR